MRLESQMNSQLNKVQPYVPGKTIEEVAQKVHLKKKDIIKLASNENVLGPSPKAIEAIQKSLKTLYLYPDGGAKSLRSKIAEKLKVRANQIILGNGSNEILEFICRAFLKKGDEVLISDHTFSLYETFSIIAGAQVKKIPLKNYTFDLNAALKKVTAKTKIVFICNPNNPTGTVVSHKKIKEFIQAFKNKKTLIVLDEAYGDFRTDPGMKQSQEFLGNPQIILLRTFSKIFGLAGLRVGYGLAHAKCIEILNRVRQPFNVNLVAQIAACAGIEDEAHHRKSRWLVWEEKKYLSDELAKLGCRVLPSEANFLCIQVKKGKAIAERLQEEGVLIRPLDSFGLKDFIRVTIGIRFHNERFLSTFKKAIQK